MSQWVSEAARRSRLKELDRLYILADRLATRAKAAACYEHREHFEKLREAAMREYTAIKNQKVNESWQT